MGKRLQEGRIVETEPLEVARLAHGQIAGQVAIYDVLVLDVLAIHPPLARLPSTLSQVNKSDVGGYVEPVRKITVDSETARTHFS